MEYYLIAIFALVIIVIIVLAVIFKPNDTSSEKFVSLTSPLEEVKSFMVRDLKTNLWLNVSNVGKVRFVPSGFGFVFRLSENPENLLPLRSTNNPNDYIIASSDNDKSGDFRIVSNPGSDLLKVQVMSLGGTRNILGYTDNSVIDEKDIFINVDQAGYVHAVENPSEASVVNIIHV